MKRYRKNNIYYTEGHILSYRIQSNKIFTGIPTEQQLLDWGFQEVKEEPKEQTLDEIKYNKINELNNYDQSNAVNSFTINNQVLWLDSQSRQQLRTSLDAYKALNRNTVSKWFNGVEFTFPLDTWYNMLNALEVYAGDALNITEQHRAIINKLDNIDDINNYDFTTDYPKKLEFNIDNK